MNILGVSALYHDSAAALLKDGVIAAAVQEERFTRKKHDERLPVCGMSWCLEEGGITKDGIDAMAFYDKPLTKFSRLLNTFLETAPRGIRPFMMGVPAWLKDKAWAGAQIERVLARLGYRRPRSVYFTEHHESHAASAFYPSPFEEAAIVTVDGVGEWACTTIGEGSGNRMKILREQRFPHSVGLLYSAFTYYTGFRVNSGEYKLMGLAPYGKPLFANLIREKLVKIEEDGGLWLDRKYFGFLDGLRMISPAFEKLFGRKRRTPESELTEFDCDVAASIQAVTEEIMLKLARHARLITGKRRLCLAGGVALNCVANGRIIREEIFDEVWIQPASGDAGGALGAALHVWHETLGQERTPSGNGMDSMRGSLLGPQFDNTEIETFLTANGIPARFMPDEERNRYVAGELAREKVVGMLQGRCEFGPRALGARSILADARSKKMQSYLNLATKFRESFRPFAPICLAEDAHAYFESVHESPYMLVVDRVKPGRCFPEQVATEEQDMIARVNRVRSDLPAITHVDYSARIQTVDPERNPRLHALLKAFKNETGCSVLINTSFNVRSEPIVCSPADAYQCFRRSGIDILVLENWVLEKPGQPAWNEGEDWRKDFGLD